jgi:hypothetical protein
VCISGVSITLHLSPTDPVYITYQWQSSPDGTNSWTDITVNGNQANYTAIAIVAGTTYYRILVTDLSNGCNDPISNSILITVEDQPTVDITVDNDLCACGSS